MPCLQDVLRSRRPQTEHRALHAQRFNVHDRDYGIAICSWRRKKGVGRSKK